MIDDPRLQALYEQLETILLVLARPVVQRQVVVFFLVLLLAWLLPVPLGRLLQRLSDRSTARPGTWQRRLWKWTLALEYLMFPVLGILFSQIAVAGFDSRGWHAGLLERLVPIFWLLLAYRIIGSVMLATLEQETFRRYHRRFVLPIFYILVAILLTTGLRGTFPVSEIELFTVLETPLTLRSIATSVVIFYLFLALSWILNDVLERYVLPRTQADPGVANTILVSSHYTVIAVGVVAALGALGFNLGALAFVLGGLSIGIGFGLQELVANFVSGILLLFEQALRPGDIIEVGGQRGTVNQLRMRATVLNTIDNIEIFVPNKTLLTSTVATYTHTDRIVRRLIPVGVSYDSDPALVRDTLLGLANNHGLVLKNPPPAVFFTDFGGFSLDFELAVWLDDPPRANAVMSDIRFMIFSEFAKRNIEIPFPQQDLHLRSSDIPLGLGGPDSDGETEDRSLLAPMRRAGSPGSSKSDPV